MIIWTITNSFGTFLSNIRAETPYQAIRHYLKGTQCGIIRKATPDNEPRLKALQEYTKTLWHGKDYMKEYAMFTTDKTKDLFIVLRKWNDSNFYCVRNYALEPDGIAHFANSFPVYAQSAAVASQWTIRVFAKRNIGWSSENVITDDGCSAHYAGYGIDSWAVAN